MTSGPLVGADGLARCPWGAVPGPMRDYHDAEWGRAVRGEPAYLERLTLEAFQSGLSWSTILQKRPAFRDAFCGFDAEKVAAFAAADHERLMQDTRIVRNDLKIRAAVTNAGATLALRDHEGLEVLVLGFAPDDPPAPETTEEVAAVSPESAALARELKRRGFVFVGPTTMHALLQATGVVDGHLAGCHRRGAGVSGG